MVANLAVLQSAAKTVTWEFSRLFKRLQTALFVYRLQALYKLVVGERGFRTVKIRLSWQLYVLATKNMLKKEKKSWHVIHIRHIAFFQRQWNQCQRFSTIFTMQTITEHQNRVYLFFLSQDRIESSASMSFLRSAHAVNDAWVLSTSLLVSRCWAFGDNPSLPDAYAWGLV